MNELVKGSSNKGVEWLHIYIDEDGAFRYAIIDARQVIPIWETQKQEEVDAVIRYYIMTVNGEERVRAEYWTKEGVRYYLEDSSGGLIPDTLTVEENDQPHFYRVNTLGNEKITNGEGWGMVPFIPFKNNEELLPDLNDYKELVDEYDKNRSDLANNLEEIQDALFVLKNYAGQDLKEFQRNLRYYRALKVDGDGDVKTITLDIPIKAKKEHTDRLAEDIFMFSQGVNVKTDKFGNSPSGVALQFLYAQLDLKCDTVERKHKKSIRKLLEFIAEYFRIVDNIDYDHNVIKITFNRSMITNEAEKVESAQKSKGVISDETIAANHPWVDDPQEEIDRLEDQRSMGDAFSSRLEEELGEEVEL
jgi:SPP1 family phage portal protein